MQLHLPFVFMSLVVALTTTSYASPMPRTRNDSIAARDPVTISVPLVPLNHDIGYTVNITIGSPEVTFQLLLDSGSADLWVPSVNCKMQGGGSCGGTARLSSESLTFHNTTTPFSFGAQSGQTNGTMITEDVHIGDFLVSGYQLAAVDSEAGFPSDTAFDGILGLASSSLSVVNGLNIIDVLHKQSYIDSPIVSFNLPRQIDGGGGGEIVFGGSNPAKFSQSGPVEVPNLESNGFWTPKLNGVTVNENNVPISAVGQIVIIDTGSSYISVSRSDADAIHQAIPGSSVDDQGNWNVPCDMTASVALVFGSSSFPIDTQDMATQPVGNNNCRSGIQSGGLDGVSLVGATFLKNVYTIVDQGSKTITFAPLK